MNPWIDLLSRPPYLLEQDRSEVERFNQGAARSVRIETSLLPEPYVGRIDAPVVLLTLNPGVSTDDFALHRNPQFRERVLQCHRQEPMAYPNYYLDPDVSGPGARWLHRIARPLVSVFGARAVAHSLALVEFFPYHSERFAHRGVRVPSQAYTLSLVQAAIARGTAIFITRGRELWYGAVPELRTCSRVFFTKSAQNIVISPNNCPDGYPVVAAAVSEAAV
jgi:hypothetical protein